jgi:carbon storage regulator CsrA
MLVLARRVGEKLVIDNAICVTVVEIDGNKVRLGVTAPASVRVDRWETHERRLASDPQDPAAAPFPTSEGDGSTRTAQLGDRVQVHYVKHFQDGEVASSRGRAPIELTVGVHHPRLPGLGLALVGLTAGASKAVTVPPELAYRRPDPSRVRRWARERFPLDRPLSNGQWVRVLNRQGRPRLVRILEVRGGMVVVDTNHRRAGQTVEMEVELVGIQEPSGNPDNQEHSTTGAANDASGLRSSRVQPPSLVLEEDHGGPTEGHCI